MTLEESRRLESWRLCAERRRLQPPQISWQLFELCNLFFQDPGQKNISDARKEFLPLAQDMCLCLALSAPPELAGPCEQIFLNLVPGPCKFCEMSGGPFFHDYSTCNKVLEFKEKTLCTFSHLLGKIHDDFDVQKPESCQMKLMVEKPEQVSHKEIKAAENQEPEQLESATAHVTIENEQEVVALAEHNCVPKKT